MAASPQCITQSKNGLVKDSFGSFTERYYLEARYEDLSYDSGKSDMQVIQERYDKHFQDPIDKEATTYEVLFQPKRYNIQASKNSLGSKRNNTKKIDKGNNPYGRTGVPRCGVCRRRHMKVSMPYKFS